MRQPTRRVLFLTGCRGLHPNGGKLSTGEKQFSIFRRPRRMSSKYMNHERLSPGPACVSPFCDLYRGRISDGSEGVQAFDRSPWAFSIRLTGFRLTYGENSNASARDQSLEELVRA